MLEITLILDDETEKVFNSEVERINIILPPEDIPFTVESYVLKRWDSLRIGILQDIKLKETAVLKDVVDGTTVEGRELILKISHMLAEGLLTSEQIEQIKLVFDQIINPKNGNKSPSKNER